MLLNLLKNEAKSLYRVKSLWIYFGLLFFISFILTIEWAGGFPGTTNDIQFSPEIAINSPFLLHQLITKISFLGFFLTSTFFVKAITRDYESSFSEIIFSTPLKKKNYFISRCFGAILPSFLILSSIGLGVWVASTMPFLEPSYFKANHWLSYLMPYLTVVFPNIVILGAVSFALACYTKRSVPVYLTNVFLFTFYLIAQLLSQNATYGRSSSLLDPFGYSATFQLTQYWSSLEKNTQFVLLKTDLLYNRLLWLSVATILLVVAYSFFDPLKREQKTKSKTRHSIAKSSNSKFEQYPYQKGNPLKILAKMGLFEIKQVSSSCFPILVVFFSVFLAVVANQTLDIMWGTPVLPVTHHVMECSGLLFDSFIVALLTLYAGEMIWRDRSKKIDLIIQSTPASNIQFYLSKFFGLIFLQISLLAVIMLSGIGIQLWNHYTHFEWFTYLKLLSILFVSNCLYTVFVLFVHSCAKSKSIAFFCILLAFLSVNYLPSFGLSNKLYLLLSVPDLKFSDLNGFCNNLPSFIAYSAYWACLMALLMIVNFLIWPRVSPLNLKGIFSILKNQLRGGYAYSLTLATLCWLSFGAYVYYETHIRHDYLTNSNYEKALASYELLYKDWEYRSLPQLKQVYLDIDFFPSKKSVSAKGVFNYLNTTNEPISNLLISLANNGEKLESLTINYPCKIVRDDNQLKVKEYELLQPILPGDELKLSFSIHVNQSGIYNSSARNEIVKNGSFFDSKAFFPVMGYRSWVEINNSKLRKKYKLPPKSPLPSIQDERARERTLISQEGSWIMFEAKVTTESNQTAIAPGELLNTAITEGRKSFFYKSEVPILNYYAFLSGKYQILKEQHQGIDIEIYHHPTHIANTKRMMDAAKKSLTYNSTHFSPYQYKQLRIIEFPQYKKFAQSFPGIVPFSEGIGFIAKYNPQKTDQIDYPFYVTAHEIAHQWWPHQVPSAYQQGSQMLLESLAQYSALMVQEQEYGPHQIAKFLKYEMNSYFSGRSSQSGKETPLMFSEFQNYLCYNKGSLAFYALKDHLSEEVLNNLLKQYVQRYAFKNAPFARSKDLIEALKQGIPEDKKYVVEDLFEKIVYYSTQLKEASYNKNKEGYEVELKVSSKKLLCNKDGQETEVAMNDLIDVGVYDERGELIYLEKHSIREGENTWTIAVTKFPKKIGIDPFNKLLDKDLKKHFIQTISAKSK